MAQQLTTYVVKTTLVDESRFNELCRSLGNYFPRFQGAQQVGKDLTIRLQLHEWYYHLDEYFDEKQEDGIIGNWTKSEE